MAWLGEADQTGRSTNEAFEEALYRHRLPLFAAASMPSTICLRWPR
jgi:hypothetical protein